MPFSFRVGHGYDVHRFAEGRPLILGGVHIPFRQGLMGHSDADALLHAVTDALLGAAGLGDLGRHFPDTDAYYRGISSRDLLAETVKLIKTGGWDIVNIDSTVVAEQPKISPYREEMTACIAQTAGLDVSAVNVKATTEEGMGFTGRGEGIAAYAVCLLSRV